MTDAIRAILIMSLSGSILGLLLFALKPLARDRLPKSAQYYLWLVVLAALLVPVSMIVILPENAPLPVAPVQSVVERIVIPAEAIVPQLQAQAPATAVDSIPPAETMPNQAASISFEMITILVYTLGVLAVLLYYIINYRIFIGLHRRRNRPAKAEELALLSDLCGRRRAPRLYRNPLAATPMLIGVFTPAIILPDREYTDEQLRSVLLHELTHLRRKDVVVKWLSVLTNTVHWFNPIVWLVRREIDCACELSCDEAVIQSLDTDGRQSYGDTLITVAADCRTPRAVLSTTMCEEKKALKQRLDSIMKCRSKSKTIMAVSLALMIILSACGMVLGASSVNNPERPAEETTGNDQLLDDLGYSRNVLIAIAETKTPYVGDNSKVGAIVNQLPIPWKGFANNGFSLHTDQEPFALTINYTIPDEQAMTDYFENPFAASMRENNALILFSAIDNLSVVNNKYPDDMVQYAFTREQIREQFGEIPSIDDTSTLRKLLSQNLVMEEFYFSHASRLYLGNSPEDAVYRMGDPLEITPLNNGLIRYTFPYGMYYFRDGKLVDKREQATDHTSFSDIIRQFGQPYCSKEADNLLYISYRLRSSQDPEIQDARAYFLFEDGKLIEEGVRSGDDYFGVTANRVDATDLWPIPYDSIREYVAQYLQLITDGDTTELARFLLIDGGVTDRYVAIAELVIEYYAPYDTRRASVRVVEYDAAERRYAAIVRDGRGDEFTVYLNYGDGLAGVDTSFLDQQMTNNVSICFHGAYRGSHDIEIKPTKNQQQEIITLLESAERIQADLYPVDAYPTMIYLYMHEEPEAYYVFYSDGSFWLPDGLRGKSPALFDYVSALILTYHGVDPQTYDPSAIRDLTSAELTLDSLDNASFQPVRQFVTDPSALAQIERMFQNARPTGGGKCPYDLLLTLTRADGRMFSYALAFDSCDSAISEFGVGVEYGIRDGRGNRRDSFEEIFDLIPWQ